jgi:hypothetical protein
VRSLHCVCLCSWVACAIMFNLCRQARTHSGLASFGGQCWGLELTPGGLLTLMRPWSLNQPFPQRPPQRTFPAPLSSWPLFGLLVFAVMSWCLAGFLPPRDVAGITLDAAAPNLQDNPMKRSASAGNFRALQLDAGFPPVAPTPVVTSGKHAVSCTCLTSILAKQEANLQIHLRKQVARVWRHFQVEVRCCVDAMEMRAFPETGPPRLSGFSCFQYSKLQKSALRQKAVEEALGRASTEAGVLREKVQRLEQSCAALTRERVHDCNVSQVWRHYLRKVVVSVWTAVAPTVSHPPGKIGEGLLGS